MKLLKQFTPEATKADHPLYAKVFDGRIYALDAGDFPDLAGDADLLGKMRSRLIAAARHRGLRIESHVRPETKTIEIKASKRLRKTG